MARRGHYKAPVGGARGKSGGQNSPLIKVPRKGTSPSKQLSDAKNQLKILNEKLRKLTDPKKIEELQGKILEKEKVIKSLEGEGTITKPDTFKWWKLIERRNR